MNEKNKLILVDCTRCKQQTKHDIIYTENVHEHDEDSGIHWGAEYEIIRCRGCETVSFAQRSWNSEDTDDEGQTLQTLVLYPSRTIRKPIEHYYYLPDKVRIVYQESLTALSNKAPILAAIGIRAVVEAVCIEKNCSGHNLESNIDRLVEKGHLAADQADFLHLQRFMGNAAAHEIAPPEQTELSAALDIAENLLTTLYVLPRLADGMKKSQAQLAKRNARLSKSP